MESTFPAGQRGLGTATSNMSQDLDDILGVLVVQGLVEGKGHIEVGAIRLAAVAGRV